MYYYLNGTLAVLRNGFAAIECAGVAYKVSVSMQTYAALSPFVGKTVKVFTYLAVREDGMDLFGFCTEDERDTFIRLISVSGIGPKAAMGILSSFTPQRLASCISANDAKTIATAPGIGLKTAQKLILELKDKLSVDMTGETDSAPGGNSAVSEAINTLVVLGYSRSDAVNALRGVDLSLSIEELVRSALRKLAKKD